jgi:hypothetical protein
MARPDTRTVGLAFHDVTCPEGPECRDRELHALSAPLVSSGVLERFLERLDQLVAISPSEESR